MWRCWNAKSEGRFIPHLAVHGIQDIRLLRRCWYKIVGKAQGQVNVKRPRPGTSPVKLARYLSKYISKDIDNQPREFEEHRYFCSLGIAVPTERFHVVLHRNVQRAEFKLFVLMSNARSAGLDNTAGSGNGSEEPERLVGYPAMRTRGVNG